MPEQRRKNRPNRARSRQQRSRRTLLTCLLCLALVVFLAVLLVCCAGGPKAPAEPDYGSTAGAWQENENGYYFNDVGAVIPGAMLQGIDVSKYQGEVDWEKAKAAGIDFAILRCGYGNEWDGTGTYNQDDEQWRRNADECTRLGIPFGVYLYSYATTEEEAIREADHVARLLGLVEPPYEGLEDYTAAPYRLDYPVYYDLEDKAITGLFPEEAAHLTQVFFDRLESLGYTGEQGIYASLNWVRGRLQDEAFDPWRENLWIARFNSELGYTGAYEMWQSTYTAPGADYGVQSESVDVDFVIDALSITGIDEAVGRKYDPRYTNDTTQRELWLAQKNDRARLLTDEPAVKDGGQKLFWSSSDENVATVNKNGVVKARGDGQCTVTATLADGTQSVSCTVRVGSITVQVFATGLLNGQNGDDTISLADVAALRASYPDSVLVDAGGSLQGTAATSLTGGMDMTSSFSAAGYDLQAFDASDLAFGAERLLSDVTTAAGPSVASNLLGTDGAPLLYRTTSWNRNRISNGRNVILQKAGQKIGFFSLASTGKTAHAAGLSANDLVQTASEQTAALRAEGVDAVICIVGPDTDCSAILKDLESLGVTAVIDGGASESTVSGKMPVLAAGGGLDFVGRMDLTFAPDGVTAQTAQVSANALAASRDALTGSAAQAYENTTAALAKLAAGDGEVAAQTLFTFQENARGKKTISFGNYLAEFYEALADGDRDSWPAEITGLPLTALAADKGAPEYGEVTRGELLEVLPAGERLVLAQTTSAAVSRLIDSGAVVRTYQESLTAYDTAQTETLLVTDTGTLRSLDDQEYTILRDYGDVFWDVRMNINDLTENFQQPFTLPEAPQYGAGRGQNQ